MNRDEEGRASWGSILLLAPLMASCSLLFDSSTSAIDAAVPGGDAGQVDSAVDATPPAPDGPGPSLDFSYDFNDDEIPAEWQKAFAGAGSCVVSTEQFSGPVGKSVKCTTTNTSGPAYIYLDFDDSRELRIELDLFVQASNTFALFFQTTNQGAGDPRLTYGSYGTGENVYLGHYVPVAEIGAGFVFSQVPTTFPRGEWHRLVLQTKSDANAFASELEATTIDASAPIDAGTQSSSVETNGERGQFTRLSVGVTHTANDTGTVTLFIDNLRIIAQ